MRVLCRTYAATTPAIFFAGASREISSVALVPASAQGTIELHRRKRVSLLCIDEVQLRGKEIRVGHADGALCPHLSQHLGSGGFCLAPIQAPESGFHAAEIESAGVDGTAYTLAE